MDAAGRSKTQPRNYRHMRLKSKLAVRFLLALAVFPALLFIPASSLNFWQAWTFLAIWFVPGLAGLLYFYKRDPQFVQRRTFIKETAPEQKLIMEVLTVIFLVAFLLPGLDRRFGWSHPPLWLTILSLAIVFISYILSIWVMQVNRFASRVVQVEPGQTVVSSGPYRLVRHPMYLAISLTMMFTPMALGSYVALPAFLLLIPLIVLRLLNEEQLLRRQLPGYTEYCLRTRFRLLPFLW
jgi:protein-S-isoprenylcysteine O-methyltransferase Ste14